MDQNRMYFYIGPKSDGLVYSLDTRSDAQEALQRVLASGWNSATTSLTSVCAQDAAGNEVVVVIPSSAVVTFIGNHDVLFKG